jgi:hypothetical protein
MTSGAAIERYEDIRARQKAWQLTNFVYAIADQEASTQYSKLKAATSEPETSRHHRR